MFCVIFHQLLYNHYSDWLGKPLLLICEMDMVEEREHVRVGEPTIYIKLDHTSDEFKCDQCTSSFERKDDLAKHKRRKHTLKKCKKCDFITYKNIGLANHMLEKHAPVNYNGKTRRDFIRQTFKVEGVKSPLDVFNDYEEKIKKILKKLMEFYSKPINAYIIMKVRMNRMKKNGEIIEMDQGFEGSGVAIRCNDEIGNVYAEWRKYIMMDFEDFKYPNPWIIGRVVNLQLYTAKLNSIIDRDYIR